MADHVARVPAAARAADLALCGAALAAWTPLLAALAAGGCRPRLHRALRVARDGSFFLERRLVFPDGRLGRLAHRLGVHRLPSLWNVLRGELSWIGPRPLKPFEADPRDSDQRQRDAAPPGLVGLWWVRRRANVGYGTEIESDLEYVRRKSVSTDAGLFARATAMWFLASEGGATADRIEILGHRIDNVTMASTLDRLFAWAKGSEPRQVAFVNADCVNRARADEAYTEALGTADLVLADGIGMRMAGAMLGQRVRENVNGTDLFPRLCERLEREGLSLYLLGGRPGVAEDVAAWAKSRYPGLEIAGTHHGYYAAAEDDGVVSAIRASGAAVLLVAFGAPKQDLWLAGRLAASGARVGIGVGGLFDFYSGRIPRAPAWLRELGLEWTWRFAQEPGRMWKRYWVGNVVFLARVTRARLSRPARREKEGAE